MIDRRRVRREESAGAPGRYIAVRFDKAHLALFRRFSRACRFGPWSDSEHDHGLLGRVLDQAADDLADAAIHVGELAGVRRAILPQPLLELELVRDRRVAQHRAVAIEKIWVVRRHEVGEHELRAGRLRLRGQRLEVLQVATRDVEARLRLERTQPGRVCDRAQVLVAEQARWQGRNSSA